MAQNNTSDASTTSTNPSSNSVPDLLTEAGFTTTRRRKRTGSRHRRQHVPIGPHPPLLPRETTLDLNTPALDPDHLGEGVRFLLQKELKNSDVGPLGRIVLPKREAEAHLPVLTAREGFLLPMSDMETSQIWAFRYRFWPNNKSRMYILENTGDFVRAHDLHLGDFIMIYKDDERDRYIIRAKKATEQVQMALSVAPPSNTEDGIFDSIVPDIVVASARYSDLYLPWGVDGCVNMGAFGLSYAFSADIPLTFPDDIFGSSSSSSTAAAPPAPAPAPAPLTESAPTPRLGSIQKLSLDDLP